MYNIEQKQFECIICGGHTYIDGVFPLEGDNYYDIWNITLCTNCKCSNYIFEKDAIKMIGEVIKAHEDEIYNILVITLQITNIHKPTMSWVPFKRGSVITVRWKINFT